MYRFRANQEATRDYVYLGDVRVTPGNGGGLDRAGNSYTYGLFCRYRINDCLYGSAATIFRYSSSVKARRV